MSKENIRFVGGPLDGKRLWVPVGVEVWQAYDWSAVRRVPLGEHLSQETTIPIVNYRRTRDAFVLAI